MPYYMRATTCVNRERGCYNVVVHWDDDDPNTLVCQVDVGSMPTGHLYDPDKRYITDDEINRAIESMGFRVVGAGPALGWGERIVQRANSQHTFYDPVTREWSTVAPLDHGHYVAYDGGRVSPFFDDENDAHRWLLRRQPMSPDWAIKHEGYSYGFKGKDA